MAWRKPETWLNPLLFYVFVCSLFPLTLSSDIHQLKLIAPGIFWIAILLAFLWSLNYLFQSDFEDGSMEQWLLSSVPLSWFVFAKMIVHVCMLGIPTLVLTPGLAVMFHLSTHTLLILILTLLLGLPLLTLLGSVGAALTISLPQGGLLMALIVLPLYIPSLIFTTSALSAAENGLSPNPSLLWLSAILVFALVLSPWVCAAAFRLGINYR
ncbi:MAG: heme exporter protein CcmB [Proteobacteria bacterium]|nr:heme exporter protein CcmB [Pseudomonadota bacterium]